MKTHFIVAALVLLYALPCQAQRVFKVRRLSVAPAPIVQAAPIQFETQVFSNPTVQEDAWGAPFPSGRWNRADPGWVRQCGPNGCRLVPRR